MMWKSMKLRLPKWVKTTHCFLQCTDMNSRSGICAEVCPQGLLKTVEYTIYHQLLNQACQPDLAMCWKHLSICYLINCIFIFYHDLHLVPHSPQHAHHNTHSFMQFSAYTNCFHYSFFPHVTYLCNVVPNVT